MPAGPRNTRAHEDPQGNMSGEERCGKWVIVLDDSIGRLVRSGSGAGGQASRQVELNNPYSTCDLGNR